MNDVNATPLHGSAPGAGTVRDWRRGLPALVGRRAFVREVDARDAANLLAELNDPEVTRFVPQPPNTLDGFDRFIGWAIRLRAEGDGACFSVLPLDKSVPLGLISLRKPEQDTSPWTWGFIFGESAWGTGLFHDAAQVVLPFAFEVIGLSSLEAWSPLANGRAHGALAKLGAEPELKRNTLCPDGRSGDYVVWTISASTLRRH
jgi:RimJ/RimL family protein N-acetyltransferase